MLVAHNTVHVVTYQEYSDGVGPSPKGGGGASPPPCESVTGLDALPDAQPTTSKH